MPLNLYDGNNTTPQLIINRPIFFGLIGSNLIKALFVKTICISTNKMFYFRNNQQALITSMQSLLGNKPNLAVIVDSVKAIAETKSQVSLKLNYLF